MKYQWWLNILDHMCPNSQQIYLTLREFYAMLYKCEMPKV